MSDLTTLSNPVGYKLSIGSINADGSMNVTLQIGYYTTTPEVLAIPSTLPGTAVAGIPAQTNFIQLSNQGFHFTPSETAAMFATVGNSAQTIGQQVQTMLAAAMAAKGNLPN